MSQGMHGKSFVGSVAVISLLAGIIVGFFASHRLIDDMPWMKSGGEMKGQEMKGMSMKGTEGMRGMEDMNGMPMDHARPMIDTASMPGMSNTPSEVAAVPAVAKQLIGVRSAAAVYQTLTQEIRTVGTVGYDERGLTQVTLKTAGWVREVFIDSVGRPVRKGEPLFTFYSPDLLATQEEYLLALRAQAQLAASPLDEAKANAASLVASARERLLLWDLTDTQITVLERRGKAEPVLTVYAPSSGIVLKREAFPGKYVEPGTTLYEVANLSTVWISADIYESEIASVRLGQPMSVSFASYPGETFRGNVTYIYPSLNQEARTVRVRFELPNPGLKLKPGMYGNVTLQTDAATALVVPKEAVLETGLRQLVFMDRGQGRYEPTSVKLGRRSQDFVEVLEGLNEGDRIVTSANFLLDAESKLTSASSMQAMMGRIGMGDWQMRGAYEAKVNTMEGMSGMQAMEGMEGMKGRDEMPGRKDKSGMPPMESGSPRTVSETRKVAGYTLTFTTFPETPKAGEVLFKLKLTNQTGEPAPHAQVLFVYTMPMPGMTDSKVTARYTKDGFYEATVMLGMGGTWVVTANVTILGQPAIVEKFQFSVAGGGM